MNVAEEWFNKHCRCQKSIHIILIIIQRDATQSSLFIILQVHSTCFACQPHPSSGIRKSVSTASGTGHIFVHLPPSLGHVRVQIVAFWFVRFTDFTLKADNAYFSEKLLYVYKTRSVKIWKLTTVEIVTLKKRYVSLHEITMKVITVIIWLLILIIQRRNERRILIRNFRGKREVNICVSLGRFIVINIIVIGNMTE